MIDKFWFKSIATVIFCLFWSSFIYLESVKSMNVGPLLLIVLPTFMVIFVVLISLIFDSKIYSEWVDRRILGNKIYTSVIGFFAKKLIEGIQIVAVFAPFLLYFEVGYLDFLKGNSDINMEVKAMRVVAGFVLISSMYIYIVRPLMIKIFKVNG